MSQTNSKVKDPVCGMIIDADSAVATQEWQGNRYHFCSASCAMKFKANPKKYVSEVQASQQRGCCG